MPAKSSMGGVTTMNGALEMAMTIESSGLTTLIRWLDVALTKRRECYSYFIFTIRVRIFKFYCIYLYMENVMWYYLSSKS